RMKSDVIYETEYNGAVTQEKYCMRPGLFCGLILLTSIENGEPLAFLNDGHLQHMRVGGDGGIGVKYMANEDAEVVGMLGPAAWRARTCRPSLACARSRSSWCSVRRARTAKRSAARWPQSTTSRSRSATVRRTSTRVPISSRRSPIPPSR